MEGGQSAAVAAGRRPLAVAERFLRIPSQGERRPRKIPGANPALHGGDDAAPSQPRRSAVRPEWRARAGRKVAEKLQAAFVFQTAVLQSAMRIRYNPEKHPSDYLDYLQLQYLDAEDLAFITADRKLAAMTLRSLQSDRILLWGELRKVKSDEL